MELVMREGTLHFGITGSAPAKSSSYPGLATCSLLISVHLTGREEDIF